jgi:hypothetical protein
MPKWLNPLKTLPTERRTSARERYPAQVLAAERRSSGPIRHRNVASAPAALRKHTRWSDGGQEQVSALHRTSASLYSRLALSSRGRQGLALVCVDGRER